MDFNDYQKRAMATAIYPTPIVYPALGLTGEAGEVADKIKKVIRDKDANFDAPATRAEIAHELGDVLWYLSALAHDIGYSLDDIAAQNLDKIESRRLRNKIHGNGDNR